MPTIDVNGTTLYYEREGNGPALCFVHGAAGDARVWADQAARLRDRYTCVRYDRRGHTRSAHGEEHISNTLHADDTAALIEALALAPCLLVSSSGGAAISVDVAHRHGHLLRGAVFSEPPLFSLDPAAGAELMATIRPPMDAAMDTGGPKAAVDAFFAAVCPGLWSAIDEERKDRYRGNAGILLEELSSPAFAITVDDLAAITTRCLVLAGSDSHPALRSLARTLATGLGDSRFVEFADCGHVTYAEQPAAFEAAVTTFATELDRSGLAAGK